MSDLVISCTLIFTAFVVIAVEDTKRPYVSIGPSTAIPFFIFLDVLANELIRYLNFMNTNLALANRVWAVPASFLAIDFTWTVLKRC